MNVGIIGHRVRIVRKRLGITTDELARRCGCSGPAMSMIETGRRGVSVEMLVKIADELNASADYLLGRVSAPTTSFPDGASDATR